MKMSRHTIHKYLQGDPQQLCRQHGDCNRVCRDSIDQYMGCITDCVNKGMTPSEIHRTLIRQYSYQGSFHSFYNHLARNAKQRGWTLNTQTHPKGHRVHAPQMVTRAGIFHYLWNNGSLAPEHKAYVWGQYSILFILERCIKEFRDIFHWQCVNRLGCFIDKYSQCGIKPLESFVCGLQKDIDAVECAVSYDWSNGFVEGSNSRLKMVKRAMFGRCSHKLLEAKMLLYPVYYC